MSNDNMGNLEKLGILVIVILVVVVGVVAITPSDTLFPESNPQLLAGSDGPLEPLPVPRTDRPVTPPRDNPVVEIPAWPPRAQDRPVVREDIDEPVFEPEVIANVPAVRSEVRPEPIREPESVVEPSRFRDVTVRKNDSLWRIAERAYGAGKGTLYRVIAAANPNVDPDRLHEGQVIRIPVDPTRTVGGAAATRNPTPTPRTPAADAVKTYVVKGGDTPMGLSTKFYGTVRHYGLLLSHNDLSDANDLQKGMTIEIPPAPETSTNVAPERSSTRDSASTPSHSSSTPSSGGRTYTVRKGEMLGRIAREQLGDASRWREILELNGLADAEDLQADTTIRLPD